MAAERARLLAQESGRIRAEELAQQQYDIRIEKEAERLFEVEEERKLQQARSNNDYQTGLMFMLIAQKNLEKGLDGMERILADIRNPGLRTDLLEGLGFLANLAGNDAVSYDTIKERVIPVLVEEARDELRRKLSGNSYQEYLASLLGFDSSA